MKKLSITVKVKAITGLLCLLGLAMLVASANAQPFHFTITSDQRGGTDAMQPFGSRTFQAIKDKVGGPGAFHVLCGDIDYAATNPSNRTLIDTYFGSNFPCYGVVGNHDAESPTTDMQWLRDEYNNGHSVRTPLQTLISRPGPTGSVETTYSWDYGNAHFIVLNCYWDGNTIANSDSDHGLIHGDASGDIKPALLTWLTNDLAATSKPFIFIFVHEPAFPYNHHYGDSLDKYPTDRDAFWSLLESHKVSAVFVGHTHYYYKHQGDKRGWTYDYPTINSWRTQDPNMAGKYGRVWEISTGNAGWTPGGVTAGPTQNDYLPTNLQWNGLEFIDVNVTEDFATVNVYRDIRPLSDSNTGLNFTLADTISINGDFLAYNDCVFDPCLVDVNTDPFGNKVAYGDLAHITNYGTGTPSSDHQSSYVFPTSGKLKDYTTGADTGVTCTMTQSGGVTWQPMVGSVSGTNWSGGYDTAPGTDAYSTFHGIADMTGVIYYGTASGWWVDANFTGLNPNKTYTFATSAARSKSTTDGAPGYLDRWTIYTISGIDSATNASTAGTTEYLGDPLRVRFNTGNNHNEGYVARWTGITPGADGKFKVRAEASPDSNDPAIRKAYAFSVFMLREEPMSPDHTPPTPNPMTWASAPTATGATSITMTANTATDANYPPVQYYFECTTDSNKSSTWQISPTYAPTGLTPSTLYTFRVKARDAAPVPNETGWSTEQSATTPQPPPGAATNPSPSTGATGIAITTDLSWTAGSNATSHDVYFGTATTPPLASSSQAGTTFDTGTMSYNTTYYWRIDEKNAGGTTTGTVWHFTTAAQSLPTFVAAGTVAYNTNAITPALPSGIAAGDILLLFLETANQAITIPTPNGGTWTEVTSSPQGTGTAGNTSATRLTVFWSRFNGTQGAPTTSDSGDHQLGRIIAVRGAATSGNPWNITGGGVEATADTSGSIPGATTTVNNTLIVAAIAAALPDSNGTNDFSAWTNSNLTSIAERTDDTTGQGNGGGLGVATGGRAATGAYGSTAVTLATSAYKGMMSIAIKPGMTPGQATNPTPINGATSVSLTQDLSWSAGSGATSRDVYFGTVNPPVTKVIADGTALTYDTGTMVNNKTYYWRVDEKNADGTTTGMIWSFTTIPLPPGAATTPSPADTAINVGTTTDLGWTAGSGATSHDVYFGTATSPPLVCGGQAGTTFDTGTMATSTTYYWRVDEKNAGGTTTGTVWSFTTVPPPPGAATSPVPSTGAINVSRTQDISWTAGSGAATRDVYFGTASTPVTKVIADGTALTFDTGTMTASATYYWRVDEKNAGGTTTGTVWSFTTKASVPNVVDSAKADANSAIIGASLTVGSITTQYSNTVAAGIVISQDPAASTEVNTGSSVNFVVSLGKPKVPPIAGLSQADANTAILAVDNLQVGSITKQYSNTVAAGIVISQDPAASTEVNTGSSVNFVVSLGKPKVPPIVGLAQADANAAIIAVDNLQVGSITKQYSNTVAAGIVISQDPAASTEVNTGSSVNFVVSLGKPKVPPIVGLAQADANAAIIAVDNLQVGSITKQYSNTVAAGIVISQSPVSGTEVNTGSSVDFVVSLGPTPRTISGHITEPDANIPAAGVFIAANNGGNSAMTDVNGYYQLTVAYGWSGNVALSKTGYIFEPNGREYINVTANQNDNYIATLKTFIISGHAVDAVTHEPLAGVLVTPDNDGGPFTTKYYGGGHNTTDANGHYEVVVDYNWSGNVVPSKYAYAFMPSSITYANVTEDKVAEENYAGTLLTYKISGHIKNACQVPIKGVLVAANNGGSSAPTDANGYYEVWVSYNWSGTVTPGNKAHYTFEPISVGYTNVLENKTGQDYAAENIYDLNCDGYIDYGDIAVIGENWLRTGPNIPGDFDKNNIVNFLDFAEFAAVWQDN